MNLEFERCLKLNKIKEFSKGKSLMFKELKTAESDLQEAKDGIRKGKYKWTTIQAYYSMFHSARALLYNKNYREKSHYCLIIALRILYVDKKELPIYLIEGLQRGKELREDADYYEEWSEKGAEEMIKIATEFLSQSRKIIEKYNQ